MEKEGFNQEEFKPGKSVEVTKEGAEAALFELKKRAESAPQIIFTHELSKVLPESEIYLVGGITRDAILGIKSDDYDLLVDGVSRKELEQYFLKHGRLIETGDTETGTFKYLPREGTEVIDVAIPRRERYETPSRKPVVETVDVTLEEDLSRRDFTFNAIALRIENGEGEVYLDLFNGIEDIGKGIVRSVGDPKERFSEDPLRILRAVRFATRFDFEIHPDLLNTIQDLRETIHHTYLDEQDAEKRRVTFERIKKEIEKSMEVDPERFVRLLEQTGLMSLIFPEIERLGKVDQQANFHSEGDVLTHTKKVLAQLKGEGLETVMAGLFHDAGKADTVEKKKTDDENEKITFYGHDKVSVRIARKVLRKYRFPNKFIDDVSWLIDNHMRIFSFTHMKPAKQKRLAEHPLFPELIKLASADAHASKREDGLEDYSFFDEVERILAEMKESTEGVRYVEIVNGDDIIGLIESSGKDFDLRRDGRLVGKVKKEVNDAYNNGAVKTKKEALELASRKI